MDGPPALPPPPPQPVLEWPEPIQMVQQLAKSGIKSLPPRYIARRLATAEDAAAVTTSNTSRSGAVLAPPVVDLSALLLLEEGGRREEMKEEMARGCREWGVFQVVNHGIPTETLEMAMRTCRSFFELPMEEKLKYANDPESYQGYGSRMGIQKDIILDWNDYYFHYLRRPLPISKWPLSPPHYR